MLTDPHLLPRCYQDRTTQAHLSPCHEGPGLWFLVGVRLSEVVLDEMPKRLVASANHPLPRNLVPRPIYFCREDATAICWVPGGGPGV
jgi:hypothetical protein